MVVNGQYPPPANYFFRLASSALFGSPATYLRRWNGIWIDRVLYTREWRRIVKEMIEEWVFSAKIEVVIATGGVGLSVVTSSAPARALALISAAIALCNSAYSLVLAMQYRILGSHAADGAGFIQKNESSSTGLQSLALICSIPGALVIWTTFLLYSWGCMRMPEAVDS
ncbi:hypothetical protein FRC12_000752 [Ceratobasidium sp. 428]|nr:hypothetical protein FRC12_000752 [Ceratobasidium sp. 428]